MLPKEEREILLKVGRYKYNKMKNLSLTYEEFLIYEEQKRNEKKLKEKIGYRAYKKMKELNLNYEEYKQHQKEQKFKKYEKKREKDKIRFKTIRYIQRYCNLEMKCQNCSKSKNIEIHHPNYNEYLKVNLLCKKCHTKLHNFELIPPSIIDLKKVAVKKPKYQEIKENIESNIENIKQDIKNEGYTYNDLSKKYGISIEVLKKYLLGQRDASIIINYLEKNRKRKSITNKIHNKDNPISNYKLEHEISTKELSTILGVPAATLRAIECGKTDIKRVRPKTKQKLKKIFAEVI